MNLRLLIKNKKAKVAVIGLGYVGLPTAVELAKVGFKVFGIDIKKERVDLVNKGKSYILDVPSKDLKEAVNSKGAKGGKSQNLNCWSRRCRRADFKKYSGFWKQFLFARWFCR